MDSPLQFELQTRIGYSQIDQQVEMLSASQFRDIINASGNPKAALMGNENTNWQDLIYRNAISSFHDLSVSRGLQKCQL